MRRVIALVGLFVVAVAAPAGTARADDHEEDRGWAGYDNGFRFESKDGAFTLQAGSRVQFRFTQEDPEVGDSTGSFRVRRAKFALSGTAYEDWKYKIQAVWSGGSTTLEDAYVQYTRNRMAQAWVGQGKAFFGRQELTSSGKQQFVDRSITSERFAHGRDQGIAVIGVNDSKTFEYNVGLYNGNGRNRSSNDNSDFLVVGRAVWTPFGEFKLAESSLDYPDESRLAVGVSAMTNSVVQSVTLSDDSVVSFDEQDVTRTAVEIAYKLRGFNAVGEYFMETGDFATVDPMDVITDAEVDTDGYYVQAGYLFPNRKFEVAARHATISPDVAGVSLDESELGLAFSYYLSKHNHKLQADVRELEFDANPALDTREYRVQLQVAF